MLRSFLLRVIKTLPTFIIIHGAEVWKIEELSIIDNIWWLLSEASFMHHEIMRRLQGIVPCSIIFLRVPFFIDFLCLKLAFSPPPLNGSESHTKHSELTRVYLEYA
jgi:hypothetical protein